MDYLSALREFRGLKRASKSSMIIKWTTGYMLPSSQSDALPFIFIEICICLSKMNNGQHLSCFLSWLVSQREMIIAQKQVNKHVRPNNHLLMTCRAEKRPWLLLAFFCAIMFFVWFDNGMFASNGVTGCSKHCAEPVGFSTAQVSLLYTLFPHFTLLLTPSTDLLNYNYCQKTRSG